MKSRNVIVILGPTAAGKSKLGVALAKKYTGVIISADSRQVYRGLEIGSGQIAKPDMHGVRHFMLSAASPRGQFSVDRYARAVFRFIKSLPASTPIFLVGGSPFYIQAITEPGSYSPAPPNQQLRKRLERQSLDQLHAMLKRKDPARYTTIDLANRRRLIRAIEIASAGHPRTRQSQLPVRVLKIGIQVPRQTVFRRIDRQIAQRLQKGMIREVVALHRQGLSWGRIEALGLEYRVLAAFLKGGMAKADLEPRMRSVTHNFAKRQMTWWKRDDQIHWITLPRQATRLVKKFLSTN